MGLHNKLAAGLAAMSVLVAIPQAAVAAVSVGDAAKLRRLDIMLMVTSLRCRFGADNFQADYATFSTNQNGLMQAAFHDMQAAYTAQLGPVGARKMLDTMSVGMANQYGQGHPWLGCGQLKDLARTLAVSTDRAELVAAADEVLAEAPRQGGRLALGN
jgi:hypothetical protein